MSEVEKGYYHCGRCGRFFQADVGVALMRRCSHCGGDPTVELDDRTDSKLPDSDADVIRGMGADPVADSLPPAAQAVRSSCWGRSR